MRILEQQRGRDSTDKEIQESFGEFVNKLIKKMDSGISSKLSVWTKEKNIFTYISSIQSELKEFEDHAGYSYDDLFINRLPEHIRNKIVKNNKEAIMNIDQLTVDLVPENANLIKLHKVKKQKITNTNEKLSGEKKIYAPENVVVKALNPFKNPTELTKYYRTFLRLYNANTKFYDFSAEVILAADILDILTRNGKINDIKFLKAWMRFYIMNSLKGNNVFKEDRTSLKEFKNTFEAYNKIYIG
jgi:hypothetical protein